ncbi:sel1 repeat domain-containing protein [Gigaspora margarita]|uniref:Sel1 repeat domain-containing protein n=1 Tax=Gigaspora margarita TaxID=4874 RepID=A0A8H4B3Q8_GIGMA|nr:sel1 repeat domain-containing protein [Gigaspora margarita]
MNLIMFNEYENYKEAQKKVKKDMQWHEFLKLNKKQYLNFRLNEANTTFPISKADFILHEWLTSYCNSMVNETKGRVQPPKKNPPIKRHNENINNNDVESALDQSDMNETDNAQDEPLTLTKNRSKKNIQSSMRSRNVNIKVTNDQDITSKNKDQSDIIPSDNVSSSLKNILCSSTRKHDNTRNTEHNAQNSGTLDEIGGRRKREQKAKEPSSHKARVTKKTKKSQN